MRTLLGIGKMGFTRVVVHVPIDTNQDETWIVSLSDQHHQPQYYSILIQRPGRSHTLFRTKNEITQLHGKLRNAFPAAGIVPPSPFPSSLESLNHGYLSRADQEATNELLGVDGKGVLKVAGYFKALASNETLRNAREWTDFLNPRHAIPHDLLDASPQVEEPMPVNKKAQNRRHQPGDDHKDGNREQYKDTSEEVPPDLSFSRHRHHLDLSSANSRPGQLINSPSTACVNETEEERPIDGGSDSETAYTAESDPLSFTDSVDAKRSNVGLRHRQVRGYNADSDDEDSSDVCSGLDETTVLTSTRTHREREIIYLPASDGLIPPHVVYDAPILLPVASVRGAVLEASTSFFDNYTYYRDLREAMHDAHLDKVKMRLVQEWTFVGTILGGLVAVGTTVFGFSSGTTFMIDSLSTRAIAASTASAVLGLTLAIWLLSRCWTADAQTFKRFAVGIYSTYFFFALTSRLPMLLMQLSLGALVVFILDITLRVLPSGIAALCIVVTALVGLQHICRGLELLWRALMIAASRVRVGILRAKQYWRPSPERREQEPHRDSSVVSSLGGSVQHSL